MKQAEELRIGNMVNFTFMELTEQYSVHEIRHNSILITPDISYELSMVSGIPVTEEWAIQLGFKPIPHFTIGNAHTLDIGRNRIISISNISSPNLTMWLQEVNDERTKVNDLICIWNWDYDKELYVHRLQNIVYSITGQELTLKKTIT